MKPDKKLEACTPEALKKALREQEEQEERIAAGNKEKEEHRRALEEARGRLAALDAKQAELKALRLERQGAIAKGLDHAQITARIDACEAELRDMAKSRSLLEDQEAAYLKALEGCEAYLKALATDLEAFRGEVARVKSGVLANTYNEHAKVLAETVRELRAICFRGGSYAFEESPKPHGRYWGDGSLARIPMLRMDWEGVPMEEAFFLRF